MYDSAVYLPECKSTAIIVPAQMIASDEITTQNVVLYIPFKLIRRSRINAHATSVKTVIATQSGTRP